MTVDERSRSAWHEASHAVAAYLLLGPAAVEVVTLRAGQGYDATTLLDREPIATATREQNENFIIVVLAGDIGGWLAEPVSGYVEETADETVAVAAIASLNRIPLDYHQRLLAAEAAPPDPETADEPTALRVAMLLAESELLEAALHLAYLRARADGMVRRHLPAIREVALALLERTTISGSEVTAIVANHRCVCHRSTQGSAVSSTVAAGPSHSAAGRGVVPPRPARCRLRRKQRFPASLLRVN
jgi:hypothetical protein